MPATVTVCDETLTGDLLHVQMLEFVQEQVTVRDLIKMRIYQEVENYNLRTPPIFKGLVQPLDTEHSPDGYRLPRPRPIDRDEQFYRAVQGFERNSYFILVDDHQVESLEQQVNIASASRICFVKLAPLMGG